MQAAVVGKTFLAFPVHAQPSILRIWQEDHGVIALPGSEVLCNMAAAKKPY